MRRKILNRAAILWWALQVPVLGWATSGGTSGGAILNIPVGARAIAMGEAYTAMADDASSLYWNPAGIALLNQSQASFMYNRFFSDLSFQNASVGVPLENGGLGASLSYLSYGQIQSFDDQGNPGADVSAYSGAATLAGAWLWQNGSLGLNVKGVQQSLDGTKASGFAADVGTTFVYPKEVKGGTLRAAAVVRNLGNGIKMLGQNDPFPRQWRVGLAAVQMLKSRLNVSLDYGQQRDQDGAFYTGAEYWAVPFMAFRAGYSGAQGEGTGMRAGLGLRLKDLAFDYAFTHHSDLGWSHRYELSLKFGSPHPRLTPEERQMLKRGKLALAQRRYGEAAQLFDALISLEPTYRPVRRLAKAAMRGYENDERAESKPIEAFLPSMQPPASEDVAEQKELESLLSASEERTARSQGQAVPNSSQEAQP